MIFTIYRITCKGEHYIGSTKDLCQRKKNHKFNCINQNSKSHHLKTYQFIRLNGGWDCCEIVPIELFECETFREAQCREEFYRREYDATLNMIQAFKSDEEYKADQDLQNLKRKEQEYELCECGMEVQPRNRARHFKTSYHQDYLYLKEELEYEEIDE